MAEARSEPARSMRDNLETRIASCTSAVRAVSTMRTCAPNGHRHHPIPHPQPANEVCAHGMAIVYALHDEAVVQAREGSKDGLGEAK